MIKDMKPNIREWLSDPQAFETKAAGFEDVYRMIDGSLCHGDGSRSITLEAMT